MVAEHHAPKLLRLSDAVKYSTLTSLPIVTTTANVAPENVAIDRSFVRVQPYAEHGFEFVCCVSVEENWGAREELTTVDATGNLCQSELAGNRCAECVVAFVR